MRRNLTAVKSAALLVLGAFDRFLNRWHLTRAAKMLARTPDLPRWLRWLLLLMIVPIPGPVDEIVALLAFGIAAVFYRPAVVACWTETA